jgi:short chain dehydrogenase
VTRGVESIAAGVSTEKGREATLELAPEKLGGLDILVNNAGGVRAGRLEDTTEAEIRAMIEVDLVAPILLTRAALPALRASKDGLVVNVTFGIALCCGAILCDLRRSQRWFGEIRRVASPGTVGRGRTCHDGVSRSDGYAHDAFVACAAGTWLHP